jgi:hypothetical protein
MKPIENSEREERTPTHAFTNHWSVTSEVVATAPILAETLVPFTTNVNAPAKLRFCETSRHPHRRETSNEDHDFLNHLFIE